MSFISAYIYLEILGFIIIKTKIAAGSLNDLLIAVLASRPLHSVMVDKGHTIASVNDEAPSGRHPSGIAYEISGP